MADSRTWFPLDLTTRQRAAGAGHLRNVFDSRCLLLLLRGGILHSSMQLRAPSLMLLKRIMR